MIELVPAARAVLFARTIASTVLLNLLAMPPKLSPGMTLYVMRAPGARPVGMAVAVGMDAPGGGMMMVSPTLIKPVAGSILGLSI